MKWEQLILKGTKSFVPSCSLALNEIHLLVSFLVKNASLSPGVCQNIDNTIYRDISS